MPARSRVLWCRNRRRPERRGPRCRHGAVRTRFEECPSRYSARRTVGIEIGAHEMNKKWFSALLFLLIISPGAAARPTTSDDQPVRAELAEINVTLKEIAAILKQQAAAQKGDLLMKRLTFTSTQLAAAQEKLKRLDQEIRVLREESADLEGRLSRMQTETPPPEETATTRRTRTLQIRSSLAAIQDRIGAVSQDKVAVENDVEALRREARDWQTLLDKTLTGMP